MMRKLFFISAPLLMCCLAFIANAQSPSTLNRISVSGNKFISAHKTPIVFHGLNTSDPDKLEREGHWDKRHFEEMKSWGANIVRFPVHPAAWRRRGQDEYLKLLDKGIALAEEQGMYVIIDWHSIGNLKTEKYQNAMYETTLAETQDFWKTMATRYKENTAVAFFELFNEPTVMSGKLGTCTWGEWRQITEELISIIRKTGATTVPLVAGFNWAYDLKEVANDPVKAEGIGYVSHPYPQKRSKPWEDQWTKDWGYVAEKYPLILTEIGFCVADDRGAHVPVISDESYGDAITRYTSDKGISYVLWVFDPQWAPMLFSDWDYTPTRQGKYFKKVLQEAAR
jgi:endoglucanase